MEIQALLAIMTLFLSVNMTTSDRCKRETRKCPVFGSSGEFEDYEQCTHFCCGSVVQERDVNMHCCGNETVGEPFDSVNQLCCSWRDTSQVHERDILSDDAYCCGTEVFSRKENPTQSCCNGYLNPPQVFDVLTEMCCGGNKQFAGADESGELSTAHTSCCGDTSFDRRVASCPCHDGVIGLGIPENETSCCHSNDGRTKSPYNRYTQKCCNGAGYDPEVEFCCGGAVGSSATQVCCGGVITKTSSNSTIPNAGCCVLNDGTTAVYNTNTSICCGGTVQEKDLSSESYSICCGGEVSTVSDENEACCDGELYSTQTSVCCDGIVGLGDSCCDGQYFSSADQQCCNGQLSSHDFTIPSCCVNQTFDSYVQTCCGATIYENPYVIDDEGQQLVSHTTRCCGDFGDDRTLVAYDYVTNACCENTVVDLNGLPWDNVECCGEGVIERDFYSCCNGEMKENIFGQDTICCGTEAINKTSTICCNGNPQDIGGVEERAACCGSKVFDSNQEICCDGTPRSLNGVPPEKAICCGNGCIDGTTYWCCNGMQYRKGAENGEAVEGLTCNDLFA